MYFYVKRFSNFHIIIITFAGGRTDVSTLGSSLHHYENRPGRVAPLREEPGFFSYYVSQSLTFEVQM